MKHEIEQFRVGERIVLRTLTDHPCCCYGRPLSGSSISASMIVGSLCLLSNILFLPGMITELLKKETFPLEAVATMSLQLTSLVLYSNRQSSLSVRVQLKNATSRKGELNCEGFWNSGEQKNLHVPKPHCNLEDTGEKYIILCTTKFSKSSAQKEHAQTIMTQHKQLMHLQLFFLAFWCLLPACKGLQPLK